MLVRVPAKFRFNNTTSYYDEVSRQHIEVLHDCYINSDLVIAVIPRYFFDNALKKSNISGVDLVMQGSSISAYGYTEELYRELIEFFNKDKQ